MKDNKETKLEELLKKQPNDKDKNTPITKESIKELIEKELNKKDKS